MNAVRSDEGAVSGSARSSGEVSREVGEAKEGAALIKRAQRRQRRGVRLVLHRFKQGVVSLLALVAGVYLVLAVRFWTRSPSVKRDYMAELNAPMLAIPEADRAWPALQKALAMLEEPPSGVVDPENTERQEYITDARPGSLSWAEALAYTGRNGAGIAAIRAAVTRPRLGASLESDQPSIETRLTHVDWPWLSKFRNAAKLLELDVRVGMAVADRERALASLKSLARMPRLINEHRSVISDLVSWAVLHLYVRTLSEVLAKDAALLSDDDLMELRQLLPSGTRIEAGFQFERLMFEDFIQRTYSDDGAGDGRVAWVGVKSVDWWDTGADAAGSPLDHALLAISGPVTSAYVATRKEVVEEYDRIMSVAERKTALNLWQRPENLSANWEFELLRMDSVRRVCFAVINVLLPATEHYSFLSERATMSRDAAAVMLALEAFRRREGEWPASIAELTEHELSIRPVDRFDGQPLRYAIIDNAPVLYSVGMDLDDDGGRPAEKNSPEGWHPPEVVEHRKANPRKFKPIPDGDWVLTHVEVQPKP